MQEYINRFGIIIDVKYYIFRHGETYQTKYNLPYGDEILTAKILPEGREVIQKIGLFLKDKPTDANYSSELLRCRETVEIVSKESGKEFVYDRRLNELTEDAFDEFRLRIQDFLNEISQQQQHNCVSICTHGGVIAGITNLITKQHFYLSDIHDYPPPGILVVLEDTNISHLDFN